MRQERHKIWSKTREKPHKWENPFKIILRLDCHQMFNKEIQCSNSTIKIQSQIFDLSNNPLTNIQEISPKVKSSQKVKFAIMVKVNQNCSKPTVNGENSFNSARSIVKEVRP